MKTLSLTSEVFTRNIQDIVTREQLSFLLRSGKQLRVKHGIDATGKLHIGHAVSLWKLRELQEAGHRAVVLIGDATTRIGDPTGRTKTRPVLSREEISENISSIEQGLKKILLQDPQVFETRKSSEWYEKMNAAEFIQLLSHVTYRRLIERDMFQKRISEGGEVFAHELVYPVLQGYDSVMLQSDLTIIGSDQLFNEHVGRFLQERFSQSPQVIVACTILPGIDGGEKMSKSIGNMIGIDDSPKDQFGKAMRIHDALIVPYLAAYTDVPEKKISVLEKKIKKGENPMNVKLFFAESLVRRYYGAAAAVREKNSFLRFFSEKDTAEAPTFSLPEGSYEIVDLLVRLRFVSSKTGARRLVLQKAIHVDKKTILDPQERIAIKKGTVIRAGKRRVAKIV